MNCAVASAEVQSCSSRTLTPSDVKLFVHSRGVEGRVIGQHEKGAIGLAETVKEPIGAGHYLAVIDQDTIHVTEPAHRIIQVLPSLE